jgi:2-iminobutanoate/2-iminopropanoate deaminase
VAQDPVTGKLIGGDAKAQAEQIFANLKVVLAAGGRTLADVVRVGVYLTDIADFATVNEVYARHFAAPFPARTCIGVAALPLGASVEIDLIAN